MGVSENLKRAIAFPREQVVLGRSPGVGLDILNRDPPAATTLSLIHI